MKKENKQPGESKAQTAAPTKGKANGKHQPAIKNTATDTVLGTVGQVPGRNESRASREDLLPLD